LKTASAARNSSTASKTFDAKELAYWTPRFIDKLKSLPELRDVASDQLNQGLLASLTIDRDTAARLGILPADIDNTLYDAFGQRQVSTIFTQLNQYHVVMEVDPQFQQDPDSLKDIYVKSSNGTQVPLSAFTRFRARRRRPRTQSSGPVSCRHSLVQSGPQCRARRRGQRHRPREAGIEHATQHPGHVPGHRGGLPQVFGQ